MKNKVFRGWIKQWRKITYILSISLFLVVANSCDAFIASSSLSCIHKNSHKRSTSTTERCLVRGKGPLGEYVPVEKCDGDCKSHKEDSRSLPVVAEGRGWNRRQFLSGNLSSSSMMLGWMAVSSAIMVSSNPSKAMALESDNNNILMYEYLRNRVISKDVSSKANLGGLQVSDIYFPSWFRGVWDVSSKTLDIAAPCGNALFAGRSGGGGAEDEYYQRAVNENVGQTIRYKARFVVDPNDIIIADREFNVASIVAAAMDNPSAFNMDIRVATPHLFSCYLGNSVRVDMLESERAQSQTSSNSSTTSHDDTTFVCSEIVQQIVTPITQQPQASSSLQRNTQQKIKLIETTTIYTLEKDGSVRGDQKTFTYLVPSQDDMIALQSWRQSQGRAIDIRTYEVIYTKPPPS